ncbi:unnamed protein product [Euphydryas editha]|uniref:CFA20 domain-containing protein n=1 Tax=Euphydryas editha TaxID=104508 RepID=A0AAU9TUY6_EUPED|nr:unnamed protein product [Euphydryas editha]
MFKNTYQSGLLSIFYSCGSNPLAIWDMEVQNGHIKRLTDNEVNSIVLEIVSTNVATTFITCPKRNQVLGIRLPFLVMIVKNLKRYFSFEITILDDKNMRRRFRISNFQSTTKIKPFCTSMPIGLSGGWNQIQFNLADFTRRAYGTQFLETLRVQVHANARLRRIYFSERLYTEEELPQDYKLYLPLEKKSRKVKSEKKENHPPKKGPSQPFVQEIPQEVMVPEPPAVVESKVSKVSAATVTPGVTEPFEEKEDVTEAPSDIPVEIVPETVVVEVSSKDSKEATEVTEPTEVVEPTEINEPTDEQEPEIKPEEENSPE